MIARDGPSGCSGAGIMAKNRPPGTSEIEPVASSRRQVDWLDWQCWLGSLYTVSRNYRRAELAFRVALQKAAQTQTHRRMQGASNR